ncbi:MAG: UvrB/UvrC motif-containing protein [Methanosarcina barkeri]|nr:UvrB/UvrC motif-containing protein [Methanosarcina sp. ERenArc_MAG2]
MPKRACLRYHIAACSGPCIGAVSTQEYGEKVKRAISVLKGNIRELIESIEKDMRELAAKQQFEQAMALRDEIAALENLQEKQNMERQKSTTRTS